MKSVMWILAVVLLVGVGYWRIKKATWVLLVGVSAISFGFNAAMDK